MFKCTSCAVEFIDGAQCSICHGQFDFVCAGIKESGYRKLGDARQSTWRCPACKAGGSSPLHVAVGPKPVSGNSPVPADLDSIALEIKRLATQMTSLPTLVQSVKCIQEDIRDLKKMKADIEELKQIKPDVAAMKSSMEFINNSVDTLTGKVSDIDQEVKGLLNTKTNVVVLQQQMEQLQGAIRDHEQRMRMNNVEIKGVPVTSTENLFSLVTKIGTLIQCPIEKGQINYIARVPMRHDKVNKSIIVSVHNRYLKDDFVAAAKKRTITAADLDLRGDNRVFVNDHLTLENKMLLNKAKTVAKERNFAFTWVKGCKIFIRKSPSSPVLTIKSEADLKRLTT